MSPFAEFARTLLREGCAVLKSPPERTGPADPETLAILERAYNVYRLSVAGPPVAFDGKMALAAAALVYWSCWLLVDHSQPPAELEQLLQMPQPPRSPVQHLSADLTFRFLP